MLNLFRFAFPFFHSLDSGAAGGGGAAAALEEEMKPATAAAPEEKAKPEAPAPKAGAKPAGDEDPEIDVGGDIGKVKRSQVQAWKGGAMKEEDYRTKSEKLQERAAQVEELEQLSEVLVKSPKKLQRILSILKEQEEDAADTGAQPGQAGAIQEQKDAIAAALQQLDPEDPAGKVLGAIYKQLQAIQTAIQGFETREQQATQSAQAKEYQDAVQAGRELLTTTLNTHVEAHKFETKEEKDIWRQMTLAHLKDAPRKYKDKDDFINAVKAAGDKIAERLKTLANATKDAYLKTKGGGPVIPSGGGGAGAKKETAPNFDNLQSTIEAMLTEVNV